jgi:general secretion pathway protein G
MMSIPSRRALGSTESHIAVGSEAHVPPSSTKQHVRQTLGFTLIELLVVMAIIAVLLSLAIPTYFRSIDTSKEAVLRENLRIMRETIDKFYADTGRYPDSLTELADKKYLRGVPADPLAGPTAEWRIVPPDDPDQGKVHDVKSTAQGSDKNGTKYTDY